MAGANSRVRQVEVAPRNAVAETTGIDSLMRRLIAQNLAETLPAAPPIMSQPQQPRRDFDMACDLLEQAARAFDILLNRSERLEQDLAKAAEQAKAQAHQHEETCQHWRRVAEDMQRQVHATDLTLKALQVECNAKEEKVSAAESRIAELARQLDQASERAQKADVLSTKLHDKLVTTFGIGSRAHFALQSVATDEPEVPSARRF